MTIPLEILESILDFLATEDDSLLSSIKACSLVSRSLLPRARTHIFRSIAINDWHRSTPTLLMFTRLITQTPEISYYVTSLAYTMKQEDSTVEGFAAALSSLSSLKSLTVRLYYAQWKDMPFRGIILNLMHLPTLTHLHVHNCDGFFLSDLTLCTGLKSLETTSFGSVEKGRDVEIYQEQPPRLESYVGGVHISPSGGLLKQLCTARRTDGKPIVDLSGLKKLSLHVAIDELDAIEKWFGVCRQLTDIHLTRCERLIIHRDIANLFLPSIRTLKHIHLEFYILQSTDLVLPLMTAFTSLMGENVIESIKLSIMAWVGVGCTYGDEWGAMDLVFSYHEDSWKKLKTFSISIVVVYALAQEAARVDELVRKLQKLPETQLRGLTRSNNVMFNLNVSSVQSY